MDASMIPPLSDLESWLHRRESSVPGLKPGVAAGIVWADPDHPKQTPLSLVYIHGYTATRGEIAPVPDRLASELGANLYYARLTGHGQGFEGHRTCTAEDWVQDAREAWAIGRAIGREVILMATSTGGTLVSQLVLGPDSIRPKATILVSPNLSPKDKRSEMLLWPGREWLLKLLVGKSVGYAPENELSARYWDYEHHSHSLIPMMDLVAQTRRMNFQAWPTPVLVVFDPEDPVVNESVTERCFTGVSEATVVRWKTAPGEHRHVLAGDALSPNGTNRLLTLVKDFLRARATP